MRADWESCSDIPLARARPKGPDLAFDTSRLAVLQRAREYVAVANNLSAGMAWSGHGGDPFASSTMILLSLMVSYGETPRGIRTDPHQ